MVSNIVLLNKLSSSLKLLCKIKNTLRSDSVRFIDILYPEFFKVRHILLREQMDFLKGVARSTCGTVTDATLISHKYVHI